MNTSAFEGWIANLSDGTVAMESKPVPGERTSWQKLLQRCRDENLRIVGLRLFKYGLTMVALGNKQCDGYFQAYESTKTWFSAAEGLKQGIGSVVGEKVYITWLSDTGIVSQEIRPLAEVKIHTTLS